MKVYIVFRDGKPFSITNMTPSEIEGFEHWYNTQHPDHKWKIKKCELKVIP
jgi:hypothetical protein